MSKTEQIKQWREQFEEQRCPPLIKMRQMDGIYANHDARIAWANYLAGREAQLREDAPRAKQDAERIASLEAQVAAMQSAPPAAPVVPDAETAWLVERAGGYYACIDDTGWHDWTQDHLKALRFARRVDADRYAGGIEIYDCKGVEHQWFVAAPTGETK